MSRNQAVSCITWFWALLSDLFRGESESVGLAGRLHRSRLAVRCQSKFVWLRYPSQPREKPAENGLFYYRESLDPAKTSMLVSAGFPAIVPVNNW